MQRSLKVLFVEAPNEESSHLRRYLENAGFELRCNTASSIGEFTAAILSDEWDCVLSFDCLKKFGALDAYAILREAGRGIPLFVVSADGDEFAAVKSIFPSAEGYAPDNQAIPLAEALSKAGPRESGLGPASRIELSRQVLREISQANTPADELPGFLARVHASIRRVIDTENCSVLLRDPLSGRTDFEYWADAVEPRPGPKSRLRSFADHVFLSGKPLLVNKESRTSIGASTAVLRNAKPWSSWIGVPLKISSRTCGVLALHDYRATFSFDERDLEFLCLVADQTAMAIERARSDRALWESVQRYRMLFDHAPDGIVISDENARVLDVNASLCRMLGYTRNELLALTGADIVAVEEIPEIERASAAFARRSEHHREWTFRRKDGSALCADVSATRMPDGNALAIVRDTSERDRAEQERSRLSAEAAGHRERLDNIIAHIPGVVWETGFVADGGRSVDFVSDYVTELLGYSVEEWLSSPEFRHSSIRADHRERVVSESAVFSAAERKRQEIPLIAKDGSEVWVEARSAAIIGPEGTVIGTRGVMIDISEQKRSARALKESEERYRDLVENAIDIIYVHDLEGNYTSINKAAETITGYSQAEILAMNMSQVIAPEYLEASRTMMAATLAGKDVTAYELEIIAKGGRRVSLEVNTRLVYADGMPAAVQGIARDITARKILEEKFRQSQKMEAIGLLAGGISHDFNNLLTAITGYAEITIDRMQPDDPMRANIEVIKETGDRASALTRQLLAFSRKQVLRPVVHNLNSVIVNMDMMLRRIVRENIEFDIFLADNLCSIEADPGQLEQVIVNLAVNAQDAMPAGGRLTIKTENTTFSPAGSGNANGNGSKAAGSPFIKMTVSDTGDGIDKKLLDRIFEPFFTTKEMGKGSGLGLATVHGIIRQSGGEILVRSQKRKGTKFEIYLPAAARPLIASTWSPAGIDDHAGSETVLLVEDDAAVRRLVRDVLAQRGYDVLEAPGGEEALEICGRHAGPIDLLLTDLVMPKMSGIELTGKVAAVHPEAKPLVMTGYTGASMLREQIPNFQAAYIEKPFTPDVLARKVREVLESGPLQP